MVKSKDTPGKNDAAISESDFQEQLDDNHVEMPAYRESKDE